jgi:hypothetical protein
MRYSILMVAFLLTACQREQQANSGFEQTALGRPLYEQLKSRLDVSLMKKTAMPGNVVIFMVPFRNDPSRIYAVCSRGEVLYSGRMRDAANGSIGILKNGEALRIDFVNGAWSVHDMGAKQYRLYFAQKKLHGGKGFCQRQQGERFSDCFKAESDEFCDSFISCVALATQPTVAIVVALSCTCDAVTLKYMGDEKEEDSLVPPYPIETPIKIDL